MIIYIDENKHSVKEIRELLEANNIENEIYDNVYWATCKEEIRQAIDCSDSLKEDKTFYDIVGDKAEDIIYDLANELYVLGYADSAFQELAEAAQLIVNRKIYSLGMEM